MSLSIKSILRDFRRYGGYGNFVLAALVLLLGVALLVQNVSASVGKVNRQSLAAGSGHVSIAAPQTTDTPTPTAILVGHVDWGLLPGSRNIQPITLTLSMGSTEINYPTQNTDASGFFTVSVAGLASGTYNYRAKGPKYLANAGTVTLTGDPTIRLDIGRMLGGDADNNNLDDILDFAILNAAWGASCGDPLYDARADFTNDCIVNSSDFGVLNNLLARMGAPPDSPVPASNGDAFAELQPGSAGNCAAPSNGGTVLLGCRFVLDAILHLNSIQDGIGLQSYLTFTDSILQNARVNQIADSCTITSNVGSSIVCCHDVQGFDTFVENEVCNGPGTCDYHSETLPPGSISWLAGALTNRVQWGTFRVAQIGLCALAPGQAVLHWQFSPPAPHYRHTAIVDASGNLVQDASLFTDYVINVVDPTSTPTATPTAVPTRTPAGNAYHILQPGSTAGNCPAPPNGGTTSVGCRFVLDLMVNAGSSVAPNGLTAEQHYLTYTYQTIQNARVSSIGSSCVPTSVVQSDLGVFDAATQNEVCNGPGSCTFRNVTVGPGSFAYSSVGATNCPVGCPDPSQPPPQNQQIFRIAQVGLCAVAPGQAKLHWQFSPPAPIERDTEIVDWAGDIVNNPLLYTDYVINIVAPTDTPTATYTPVPTNTYTPTPTPTCDPVWSVVSSPNAGTSNNYLYGVAVVSANDVWAAGYYYNGSTYHYQTLVEHWNGTAWSVVSSPNAGTGDNRLLAVAVVSVSDVWAVGYYLNGPSTYQTLVEHWNGTAWSVVSSPNVGTGDNRLLAVGVVSVSDVWAVGYYDAGAFQHQTLVEHWNGTAWSVVSSPNVGSSVNYLYGVSAVSSNDVWAVGYYYNDAGAYLTLTAHWNGTAWSVVSSPNVGTSSNYLYGVAVVSASDVWAVGGYNNNSAFQYQTLVEHWNGTAWSVVSSPNTGGSYNVLDGVAVVSANDVWAVGGYAGSTYQPLSEHWDGTAWSVVSSPNTGGSYYHGGYYNPLSGVAAISANDVWTVGYYSGASAYQALVEHYGSVCSTSTSTPVSSPTATGTPTLLPGDADNNNVVDATDYAIFRATFGRGCGDPLFDARADFNRSCVVNASDFGTMKGSFGKVGASPYGRVPPSNGDAYLALQPGIAGNCNAPANGGTVQLGCRFVLDLMVNSGSITNTLAQQSYLTFTSSILQIARVNLIGTSCVPSSTLTPDLISYDASLQNEVCNGPASCVFRGNQVAPGSLAFAAGGLNNCSSGCGGDFRVAQVGLCAVAPGQAVLHWQFSPPAPRNRNTEIVDLSGSLVQDARLFTDYVINVTDPNATPTATPSATPPANTPIIRGHGTWEGRQPQPDPSQMLPISLTLRLTTGGPYIDYPFQTTDASGLFTVSVAGLPGGTYIWRAKGPQYLANAGTITLAGDPVTLLEAGLLRTGDANGDNVVNVNDFNILKGSFGLSCGQGGYDGRADFTGDCTVNVQDFNPLKRNFGLTGASPINVREP